MCVSVALQLSDMVLLFLFPFLLGNEGPCIVTRSRANVLNTAYGMARKRSQLEHHGEIVTTPSLQPLRNSINLYAGMLQLPSETYGIFLLHCRREIVLDTEKVNYEHHFILFVSMMDTMRALFGNCGQFCFALLFILVLSSPLRAQASREMYFELNVLTEMLKIIRQVGLIRGDKRADCLVS